MQVGPWPATNTVGRDFHPVERIVVKDYATIATLDFTQHPAKGDVGQARGGSIQLGTPSNVYREDYQLFVVHFDETFYLHALQQTTFLSRSDSDSTWSFPSQASTE
jgi:hypothetical protein